jgi:hypothetical protein
MIELLRNGTYLTLLSFVYFTFSLSLNADVITFKNGKQVEGILKGQTRTSIIYAAGGKKHRALKKDI